MSNAETNPELIDREGTERPDPEHVQVIEPRDVPLGGADALRVRRTLPSLRPVSYTHLDVYKRQVRGRHPFVLVNGIFEEPHWLVQVQLGPPPSFPLSLGVLHSPPTMGSRLAPLLHP